MQKRKRSAPVKKEAGISSSDSELSEPPESADDESESATPTPPPAKRSAKPRGPRIKQGAGMKPVIITLSDEKPSSAPAKGPAKKANPYGLTPGTSPYPDYPHPTPAECAEVHDLLTRAHGSVTAPTTIPTPSLSTSGCGEVPSVLDALIRTRLSAATNGANSSRAFRGLVQKFGILERDGPGKGSVDWDKVRTAPRADVFAAIQSGGLATVKSRDIQNILQMVWVENQARRDELVAGKDTAAGDEDAAQEVAKADASVLSLDHLHALPSDAAFAHLLTYPGIGPKTASCVLLFCLQRPSFAVDTHVFRLSVWLGWVPRDGRATRNSTYAHLDVRIPDDMKYALHYLFIRHGKTCGFCSAKAGAKDRVGKTCPLAHLMVRGGKGAKKGAKGPKKVKKRGVDASSSEEEEEEAEMTSDDDDDDVKTEGEDDGVKTEDEDSDDVVKEESGEEDDDIEMHNMKVQKKEQDTKSN